MFKLHQKILILFILFFSFPVNHIISSGQNGRWRPEPVLGNPGLAFDSAKVPLGFIQNKAQAPEDALYNGPTSGSTSPLTTGTDEMLQFSAGGHVLGFRKGEMFIASGDHALRVEFANSRPTSPVEEIKSMDLEKSRDVAQPLGKLTYHDLWDGVTLVYEKHGSGVVKSTYYLEPANIRAINPLDQVRLRYNVPVKVDGRGNLLLSFTTGEMRESRPVAWQEIEGKRVPVEVTYRLRGEQEVGFKAGSYDPRYPLAIDPVLSWNTFLGSSSTDSCLALAVDTSGNVYVAGQSLATWGSPVRGYAGLSDAFAAKLNGSGALQWNTFLGGSLNDYGEAIAVDTSGNVYVAGYSLATWGSPVRPFAGSYDAFAAKLNGSGALQWSTFLGSSSHDEGHAIAVGTSGNVYVAGYSNATWGSPVRPYSGFFDAFAAKLSGNGALQWNTFLGSSFDDRGFALAVDTSENVYVAGDSHATWGSPIRPFGGGDSDAFAAKVNGSGALQWNTFLGGSSTDWGHGIAVDTSMNVCVAGPSSTTWGTPVRPYAGSYDAFVAKISCAKNDFNGDGYGDILWRYYGSGGKNAVWYMGYSSSSSIGLKPFAQTSEQKPAIDMLQGKLPEKMYADPREAGGLIDQKVEVKNWEMGRMEGVQIVQNPAQTFKGLTKLNKARAKEGILTMLEPKIIGSAFLLAVPDLNWKIVGTGDFNGDGWPDILWRNYVGGYNVVWYMKGAIYKSTVYLFTVTDLNWQIVGTGDFNGDGWPDILWRNSMSGDNVVWYMEGATYKSTAYLLAVTDLNWKIEGTGDFNRDGWPDILWRNYVSGDNVVWYMEGATYKSTACLTAVTDLNWQIGGTGDFNGDGWPDILWRYYGTGGLQGRNVVWYMKGATLIGSEYLTSAEDVNWRIQNH